MSKLEKLLYNVISGRSDTNIAFSDLCRLLQRLGFSMRVRGSHRIFSREGVEELINRQQSGAKASLSGHTGSRGYRQIRPQGDR